MAQPDIQIDPRTTSGARRPTEHRLLALVLLIGVAPGWAESGPPGPGASSVAPVEGPGSEDAPDGHPPQLVPAPDPSARWLDEVRAQRQAWEERRRASREAFEARRRLADPWGTAQHDAWEDEVERRREARRLQREHELEHFRGLRPSDPPLPWPEAMDPQGYPGRNPPPTPGSPPSASAAAGGRESVQGEPLAPGIVYPPDAPTRGPYSPQDWDNLWYYRGY
jgi:hypothetical protein